MGYRSFAISSGPDWATTTEGQPHDVLRGAGSYAERVNASIELAKWNLGFDYPQARLFADSALSSAIHSNDEVLIGAATTTRALVYWHNGEYKESIHTYLTSLSIQERLGNTEEIGVNCHGIAMNYYYMADYSNALAYHERALNSFRSTGNKSKEALVLNHIGLIHHKMSNYPKAIELLFESSKVQQDLPGYQGRLNSFAGKQLLPQAERLLGA